MDILTQLNRAVAYIEEHIDDDIKHENVSKVTSFSSYHFGRLFYYITDMTLSDYIRKRKLSNAAIRLQNGSERILDIALDYGYDSADSFTRAFVKQHGITPSAARKSGVQLSIFTPLTFQIKVSGVEAMNYRIEEREAFEVFGVEKIFRNDETDKVPGFWDEIVIDGEYSKLCRASGKDCTDEKCIPRSCTRFGEGGICAVNAICGYCEPGENTFPYMICALKKTDSDTAGFKIAQVPKATWAVFRGDTKYKGHAIPELFRRAYSEWLPSSGYDKAIGPDMEIYYKDFEEVWIPVKKV
jgi:AraC family transcriptional regulator